MSQNLFQDTPLSNAQVQQDYALQKIKVVNDAVVAGAPFQGPDAGDNPPGALADLNRRLIQLMWVEIITTFMVLMFLLLLKILHMFFDFVK